MPEELDEQETKEIEHLFSCYLGMDSNVEEVCELRLKIDKNPEKENFRILRKALEKALAHKLIKASDLSDWTFLSFDEEAEAFEFIREAYDILFDPKSERHLNVFPNEETVRRWGHEGEFHLDKYAGNEIRFLAKPQYLPILVELLVDSRSVKRELIASIIAKIVRDSFYRCDVNSIGQLDSCLGILEKSQEVLAQKCKSDFDRIFGYFSKPASLLTNEENIKWLARFLIGTKEVLEPTEKDYSFEHECREFESGHRRLYVNTRTGKWFDAPPPIRFFSAENLRFEKALHSMCVESALAERRSVYSWIVGTFTWFKNSVSGLRYEIVDKLAQWKNRRS